MKEKWIHWDIPGATESRYFIDYIGWPEGQLVMKLCNANDTHSIEFYFGESLVAFEITNESFSFSVFGGAINEYEDGFFNKKRFFKRQHSDRLKVIAADFTGTAEVSNLQHFCIFSSDHFIEIVATDEPKVIIKNL